MRFDQDVLNKKVRNLDLVLKDPGAVDRALDAMLGKNAASWNVVERPWSPGGGSTLVRVSAGSNTYFMKIKSVDVGVESFLECEAAPPGGPSLQNEARYLELLAGDPGVPRIVGKLQQENMIFLLLEELTPSSVWLKTADSERILNAWNDLRETVRSLYSMGLVHTDIHEKNILFRGDRVVLCDFEECRPLAQDVPFEDSLDVAGANRYGDVGEMPEGDGIARGRTCLSRLRSVWREAMLRAMPDLLKQCNFDSSCPFLNALDHGKDERIYQSITTDGLVVAGQRPVEDRRIPFLLECFHKLMGRPFTHLDVGANIGRFNIELVRSGKVSRSVGIEAFERYVVLGRCVAFLEGVDDKVELHVGECGQDSITDLVGEGAIDCVTIYSVYHHIRDKKSFLKDIKRLAPKHILFEMPVQRECYEGRSWEEELDLIGKELGFGAWERVGSSEDFQRPVVLMSNPSAKEPPKVAARSVASTSSRSGTRVSVVLPTYNHLVHLRRSIDSILAQSMQDFELIVVNDGSTDGTREWLDSLSDRRIRVVHQDNARLPSALNRGFSMAVGELLTWTSADNLLSPAFLAKMTEAMDSRPDAVLAVAGNTWIDPDDNIDGIHRLQDLTPTSFLVKNPGIAAFMYRSSARASREGYDPSIEGAEDWDMWQRLSMEGIVLRVPDVLYHYRRHEDSMTVRKREQVAKASREVFARGIRRMGERSEDHWFPGLVKCRERKMGLAVAFWELAVRMVDSPFCDPTIVVELLERARMEAVSDPEIILARIFAGIRAGETESNTRALVGELARLGGTASNIAQQVGALLDSRNRGALSTASIPRPGRMREYMVMTDAWVESTTWSPSEAEAAPARSRMPLGELESGLESVRRLIEAGRLGEAIDKLGFYESASGGSPELRALRVKLEGMRSIGDESGIVERALRMRMEGDVKGALAALSEAAERWPNSYPIAEALARGYVESGELALAQRECQRAVQLSPSNPEAHANLAAALISRGQIDRAEVALEKVVELDPSHLEARFSLGRLRLLRGAEDGADMLRRFLHLAPDNEYAVDARILLMLAGHPAPPRSRRLSGLGCTIDDWLSSVERGEASLLEKDYRKALPLFLGAQKGKEDDPVLLAEIGICWHRLGDGVSARSFFERALVFAPSSVALREIVGGLPERDSEELVRIPHRQDGGGRPRINVAMLTFNALSFTKKSIESISRTAKLPFRLWILDNASEKDDTRNWLASQDASHVRIELGQENLGVPGGRNRLIDMALPEMDDDDFLVFTDNDMEFFPGWDEQALSFLDTHPEVGILSADGTRIVVHESERTLQVKRLETDKVDVACGGYVCWVRARALRAVGGFDEHLGLFWHEDDDFTVHVLANGYEAYSCPELPVLHHGHQSGVANPDIGQGGSRRNQEYLCRKWRAAGMVDLNGGIRRGGLPGGLKQVGRRERGGELFIQTRTKPTPTDDEDEPGGAPAILDITSAIKGRIPIAMPAYNRDKYLAQVLTSLRRCNDLDKFFIVTGEEPGCPGTSSLFDSIDWIPIIRGRNKERLGCNGNVIGTIDRAMELSDRMISLEDDVVPAQDFLSFVLWGLAKFREDHDIFDVGGYQRHTGVPPIDTAMLAKPYDWFSSWGWATWRDRWEAFRRDVDVEAMGSVSWDCFVVKWAVEAHHLKEIRPLVGRIQNVGEEGTWVPSAQWQRENQWTPHWMGNLGWKPVSTREFALEGESVGVEPAPGAVRNALPAAKLSSEVGCRKLSGVLSAVASGLRGTGSGASTSGAAASSVRTTAPASSSASILLDLRTLADPNSISRGIGHYSLHLARAILVRGGHRFGVLWDDRAGMERRPDLGTAPFEWVAYSSYQPGGWDLVHVFDPMGNHPDYEDPFTLFAAEPRLSLTFYDLIPWHIYRETMGRYWEVYLTRLERMKESDATYMCISRFTAEDLVREIGIDAARTEVVMAGLNAHHESGKGESHDRSLIRSIGIDGPFCLYVGAVDQHKNFDGAVNAWNRARTSIPGLKLVVVGRRNGLVLGVEKQVREMGLSDGIVFTDFVERDVLEALYRRAIATLFLSRFEGFGFPVLEAMAAQCPVICSSAASIPEVAGDAAIVCGPDDHDAAAAALVRLHRDLDLRNTLVVRGEHQAASFTWDKVASAVLERWSMELRRPPRTTNLHRIPPSHIEMFAPIYDPSGYAAEARPVLKHLVDAGLPVKATTIGRTSTTFREGCPAPMRKDISTTTDRLMSDGLFVQLIWFPGYAFARNSRAAWNVGRTMFETDALPKDWIEPCNSMNEIWVPTDFNMETFRKAGVTVPLLKVPGGVDTATFRPGLEPLPIPGKSAGTTFLSVFEWTARKGFDILLKGWARAFKPTDDVRLVLRTYPPNQIEGDPIDWVDQRISEVLASVGATRNTCAPIVVLAGQVPEVDMPRLYNAADVYLAPSRGEGWGRPHMEAMSCGVPVIATRWSGNLEFQDDANTWLIDVDNLVPVGKDMAFKFYQGQNWAEPSLDSFVGLLDVAWKNVEERRAKGARARHDMEERWDWSISARFVSERLAEILQGIPPEHSHLADAGWRSRLYGDPSSEDRRPLETLAPAPKRSESEGVAGSLSVRWEGSQFVHHSLAHVNRELCAGLAKKGHDLSIIPYEPDQFGPGLDPDLQILQQLTNAPLESDCQVHVRHQWPPNLTPPKEGRWVVVQPWEFGSPPKEWMPAFRDQIDELWAYTEYVRDLYVRAGVPEDRVHVVPLGVDCDKFRPGLAPLASLPPKRGVRFLYVGGSIARKGFDTLLNAWQKAFGPDDPVELLIKDMGGKSTYAGQTGERFVRQIVESGCSAPIRYLNDDLAPADLPALYASGDVLVHPYRGEGFGLPIAEAMACGLPVIISAGGAADDFCGREEAWMIPTRRVPLPGGKVDQMETVEAPWWLEVSEEALVAAMRDAATNSHLRAGKGAAARLRILEGFTWGHAVEAAERRLHVVASRPIRRFETESASATSPRGLAKLVATKSTSPLPDTDSEDLPGNLLEIEMMVSRGEFAEADRLSEAAVSAHPRQPMAWLARGMVLRGLGKFGRALEALNKALEAGGGAEVHYEMLALQLQGNKEGAARAQWNILREQYPEWVERQRAHHKAQGHPWLPDRLEGASKHKAKSPKARKR